MWRKPIVEIRVEEYERGRLPEFLSAYREMALPIMTRHVGRPLAFYGTSVGRINCVTQLWGYDSIADYGERRTAVDADPGWRDYLRSAEGVVRHRDSRLTRRIGFASIDAAPNPMHTKRIVDFRTYEIRYDKMPKFLETTEQFALDVMVRHIGPPLGYYMNVAGNLQEITHLWGYDSMGDMETRRAARNEDPDWMNYVNASDGIYEGQSNQVLHRLELFEDE